MGKMKSIRAKLSLLRVLKIAFYLLGFPLLLLLIKLDTVQVAGGVLGIKAYLGVAIVAACWVVLVLVQIIAALITKKSAAKAVIAAIIAFVVMLAPLAYIEFVVEKKFAEYEEKYKDADFEYEFDRFELQTRDYKKNVNSHDAAVTRFLFNYNIDLEYALYSDTNTDLTEVIEDTDSALFLNGFNGIPHYTFGKDEGGAVYSPNGLYADGYVFGLEQARHIFRTFYGAIDKFAKEDKNIDEELLIAIRALETNPNSAWSLYKQTDAYKKAYQNNDPTDPGNAKNYYISIERLDSILRVLGRELSAQPGISGLLDFLAPLIGIGPISLEDLSLDTVLPLLETFGLTEADLVALLEGLTYYQSPTVYPVFFFVEDATLRDYAYAKYLGEVHGAKVGSILVTELPADPNTKLPNVGKVTMEESGQPPMSKEDVLEFLYIQEIEAEFMPELYPYLIIRNNLFIFAGIVPLTLLIAYYFADREKKNFYDNLKLKEGVR